jgi:hypothetical protein
VSASIQPASGIGAWRILIIGVVAALAIGIGVAAGGFFLTNQAAGVGTAASYVRADAPFYLEMRLEASEAQDGALRELLGRFPPIDGLDLDRPLFAQLGQLVDEELATHDEVELSWAEDVEPWWDGRVTVAVTDIPFEDLAVPTDPMGPMPESAMPGMIVVLGVSDPAAADELVDRMRADAVEDGAEFSETTHAGTTIVASASEEGAYAITDDALLFAPSAADIETALDTQADADAGIGAALDLAGMAAQLPADWLAFGVYDMTDMMAASIAAGGEEAAAMSAALDSLLEHQPMRGAMAVSASGDRLLMDAVSAAPTGPFTVENADRGLAAEAPGDALYYSESGNIGAALTALIETLKEAAATDPEAAEQIATAEAALGANLEELVAWVDDGAIVAGWDGTAPYGGLVLVPNDVAAGERRLGQLATFAGLAGMDPDSGVSVSEDEIAGATVTTIRWDDPSGAGMEGMMVPTGVAIQYTVTDDRALIGIGETFVARVLELDADDSLAANSRFTDAIDEFGGAANAGATWLDLDGTREAIMSAVTDWVGVMDPEGTFEREIEPWLLPLDRMVTVTVLDGDLLVSRSALLLE